MRKHKSVVAILLAVMMIFTFMPTMAFAADEVVNAGTVASWSVNDFYATCTDSNGHPFNATRTFGDGEAWNTLGQYGWSGMVFASVADDTSVNGKVYKAPVKKNADGTLSDVVDSPRFFFDLNGSSLVYGTTSSNKALDKSEWTKTAFDEAVAGGQIYVKLVKQNYAADSAYKTENAAAAYLPVTAGTAANTYTATLYESGAHETAVWTLNFKLSKYDSENPTTKQTLTFSYEGPDANGEVTDGLTRNTAELIGVVPDASVTIDAQAADKPVQDATKVYDYFFMDEVKTSSDGLAAYYTGAEHKVVAKEFAGYTVSYGVYNKTTGKYDAAPNGVSLTDVGTVKFAATYENATTKDKVEFKNLIATVNPAPYFTQFGFVTTDEDFIYSDGSDFPTGTVFEAFYKVGGSEYNVADYLDVAVDAVEKNDQYKKEKEATAAAVAANKTELMSFFNDYFDVDTKVLKGKPDYVYLAISAKTFDDSKAKKALDEKYAKLIKNFGMDFADDGVVRPEDLVHMYQYGNESVVPEAVIRLNADAIDPMAAEYVEFVKSPTAKTYAKSKTTKKGVLKKNQTIQFTAEADNGATVVYKLVNAPAKIVINKTTGKVTVKKGIKKGTYSVKVKAYVKGNKDVFETHTLKVKIKK